MAGTSSRVVLAAVLVGVQIMVGALAAVGLVGADSSKSRATTSKTSPAEAFPLVLLQPTTTMGAPSAKSASRQDIRRLNAGIALMRTTFQRNDTLLLL